MKKLTVTLSCLFSMLISLLGNAQDFSNKGKDFWIGYGNHVRMFNGGAQVEQMQLYITSDVNTTGQVSIASVGFSQNFTITANQIVTIDIPRSAALLDNGLYNHGIHVISANPVVVYSFIYVNAQSGATVCLPTATLGRDYYSVNFDQVSNEANSASYFFVIAADTGTTTVEITPSALTKGGKPAGVPFLVNLTQGQIYQVLGSVNGNNGVDLTGSRIRSINTGTGCKRIAVYCGSGKISIGCSSAGTSDNLYQQMYPTATWGKKYITVPGVINSNNYFRIIKSDASAVVKLNGSVVASGLFINNFYYQFLNNQPNVIESDKLILVAQYFTTQGCNGNPSPGDPEMIYLNPVEQTIDKVTLNSMQPSAGTNITQHYLNVVIKNDPAAINTFKIDGMPYTNFTPVPNDNTYSYARITTTQGTHNIVADTGFNIIAYGFGNAESYGYSGGTNLKDLYQFVSIQNEYATVDFPASCKSSPFFFSITFPYQPTQIKWFFNGLFPDVTVNTPVYDSTWTINGKQLYLYKLTNPYTINAIGTYPIKLIAQNPTLDGCTGEQEIDYDLQVFERPSAKFTNNSSGCLTDSVQFTDNSSTGGRAPIKWQWSFGDNTTSNIKNPIHLYTAAGSYTVKYSLITDVGCLSDTASEVLTLSNPPVAKFGIAAPFCAEKLISFSDSSTSVSSPIVSWQWNFGDGSAFVTATTNATQQHSYKTPGTYTVSLKVTSATGCQSLLFQKIITINPNPTAIFKIGNGCLPNASVQFTDQSTISDGTQALFTYSWNFGDGTTGNTQNPTHLYTSSGQFNVTLLVTSGAGCADDSVQAVKTIYAQPKASFNVSGTEVCLGTDIKFTDNSSAANSTITGWQWDFGDGTTANTANPTKNYASGGKYIVKLVSTSAIGCTSDTASKTIIIDSLPTASFTIAAPNCVNQINTFTSVSTANSGTITQWKWNFGDGTNVTNTNANPLTHSYKSVGAYPVSLQVVTDKGCSSTVNTQSLNINPVPSVGFILPENCLNDPFSQFTDTSHISDGTEAGFTYAWNFGDPNATPANPNTGTQKNPRHKYSSLATYPVMESATSNKGCTASFTQSFTVNGTLPVSAFTLVGGTEICSNDTFRITNNSTVDFGRVVRVEVYWDYVNNPLTKMVDSMPVPGKVYGYHYPEFFTPAAKSYVIRLVAYSGDNCLSTSSQTIILKATPELQFAPLTSVCANVPSFVLHQGNVLNGIAGKGTYSGAGITADSVFNPSLAGAGTKTIRYTFTATNGCSNYKEQPITVFAVPTVSAGPDQFILEGGNTQLLGVGSGNGISYAWTPALYLNNATIAQPTAAPTDYILYRLTVTSADGCKASDDVQVTVLKTPVIPNTFSPNGDGVHDLWAIPYLDTYPGATVEIFNRYGQLVFHSVGYTKPWDGTYNGKPVPVGTYYYIVNPKNGRKQMAGFVDVIR